MTIQKVIDDPDGIHLSKGDGIAIIDADSMIYICMGAPTLRACKLKLDTLILNSMESTNCSSYIGCLSVSDTFRVKIGKTKAYKGNRTEKTLPNTFYPLKEYAQEAWGFFSAPGLEADDLVCAYAEKYDPTAMVLSIDKDVLQQYPGTHYNYRSNEVVKTSRKHAWWFLWMQVLAGDPTDNIPGLPGIGLAKATKILEGVNPPDYPLVCLREYIESDKWDTTEGMHRFKESYDLVYLLKTPGDFAHYGLTLPAIEPKSITEIWKS